MKKICYVDMDNVLVDFRSGIARLSNEDLARYEGDLDDCPRIFPLMDPMPDAVESYFILSEIFDTYILSTAPWKNPDAWKHKVEWVKKYFGETEGTPAYKRLIISHRKHLNRGDYLIDDRPNNGAAEFRGEWIHFGSDRYPDWHSVVQYLTEKD